MPKSTLLFLCSIDGLRIKTKDGGFIVFNIVEDGYRIIGSNGTFIRIPCGFDEATTHKRIASSFNLNPIWVDYMTNIMLKVESL